MVIMLWQSRRVFKVAVSLIADSTIRSSSFSHGPRVRPLLNLSDARAISTVPMLSSKSREDVAHMDGEVLLSHFLERLKNFEKEGVPKGAGTDSVAGFDLLRMERLLARLGNPLSSYPVVHVAGTKGKGSTVSFISSILRAAGLSVGTYTSPHVTSIRERITAGKSGNLISSNALSKLVADSEATIAAAVAEESGLLTHFEVSPSAEIVSALNDVSKKSFEHAIMKVLTALAFTHFAREKVNVAVVETGLGGARDATNVISAKGLASAVIVGIGCEHLAALGGSLESIALAKAGIIKENRPVILGPQMHSEVPEIIKKVAASKGSPLIIASRSMVSYGAEISPTDFDYPVQFCDIRIPNPPGPGLEASREVWKMENVKLRALGAHQQDNALTAVFSILGLRAQGWQVSDSAIRVGLEATEIPGRFQFVGSEESEALGCLSARLILDGAHTEESGTALGKTLREYFPTARLAIVVAMASDKDKQAFARALLKETKPDVVVTTRVPVAGGYGRSFTSQELAECWSDAAQALDESYIKKQKLHVTSVEPMQAAIKDVAGVLKARYKHGEERPVICVCGSLHAVAATLSLFQSKIAQ